MPPRRAPAQTADMPFTVEQFFEVFRSYNETLWPAQLLLYAPAAAALIGTWKPHRGSHRLVAAALAVLWLWTGVVYHFGFFRTINPAASLFAAISVAGAGMFAWHGVVFGRLRFAWQPGARGWVAAATITYALLLYPALGLLAGQSYWESPSFGAPCPTTIFTLGMLMLVERPFPRATLVAPVLWALIGSYAALALGVPQDYGLFAAAAAALAASTGPRPGLLRS